MLPCSCVSRTCVHLLEINSESSHAITASIDLKNKEVWIQSFRTYTINKRYAIKLQYLFNILTFTVLCYSHNCCTSILHMDIAANACIRCLLTVLFSVTDCSVLLIELRDRNVQCACGYSYIHSIICLYFKMFLGNSFLLHACTVLIYSILVITDCRSDWSPVECFIMRTSRKSA